MTDQLSPEIFGNHEARINDLEKDVAVLQDDQVETNRVLHSIDKNLSLLTAQMRGLLWLLGAIAGVCLAYGVNRALEQIWP